MAVFEYESNLECSVSGLFDFMARPENIAKVGHPDLGLKFVSPPEVINIDDELKFQIVSFGQVLTMKHKIIQFDRPTLVVEDQIDGPMKSWRHHHIYKETENGCVKTDRIEFEPPGGMIGFFLTEAKIVDQLEDGMFIREQRLKDLLQQGQIQ